MFEAAPVQMVHCLLKRGDATSLCPRRSSWQLHCANDSRCFECGTDFVDLADLHQMYFCGVLGRHLAGKSPLRSGRRRIVMVINHGNVEFSDIDTIKMDDHPYGKSAK